MFQKGRNTVNLKVDILADDVPEEDEMFFVKINNFSIIEDNISYEQSSQDFISKIAFINYNDNVYGTYSIYFKNTNLRLVRLEEDKENYITIIIIKNGGEEFQSSVQVSTSSCNASKADFHFNNALLIFKPKEKEKKILFGVINDDFPEDEETVKIELKSPSNKASLNENQRSLDIIIDSSDAFLGVFEFLNSEQTLKIGFYISKISCHLF